jgi:hypothetical protein
MVRNSPLSSSWASKSRKLPPPAAAAEKVPEIWHSTRATAKALSSGRSGLLGLETSHFSIWKIQKKVGWIQAMKNENTTRDQICFLDLESSQCEEPILASSGNIHDWKQIFATILI